MLLRVPHHQRALAGGRWRVARPLTLRARAGEQCSSACLIISGRWLAGVGVLPGCWPAVARLANPAGPSPQPGAGGIAPRRHCPFTSALPRIAVITHACPNTTGARAGITKSQHGVGSQNRVPKWWSTEGNRNFRNSQIATLLQCYRRSPRASAGKSQF